MGRDGIEPSTGGSKGQASHQHADPTTCRHNDLVVRGRAAWWRFEAASVPNKLPGSCSIVPARPRLLGRFLRLCCCLNALTPNHLEPVHLGALRFSLSASATGAAEVKVSTSGARLRHKTSSPEPVASGPALSLPLPIETRGDEEPCEFQAGEYS